MTATDLLSLATPVRRTRLGRSAALTGALLLLASCGADPNTSGTGAGAQQDTVADTGGVNLADVFTGQQDIGGKADAAAPKDSGAPDTGTSDTGAVDTGTPDTGAPDTGTPDTAVPTDGAGGASCVGKCGKYDGAASCQCDDLCSGSGDCCADYSAVCGGDATESDASGPDGGSSDAASPDASSGDGGGATNSCQGLCGKYVGGNACQCDSGCTGYGDCCADYAKLCSAPGCAKDADCDDKLDCTTDKCVAGTCKQTPVAKACVIDGACYKEGDQDANTCLVCKPDANVENWTVDVGATCDDGNACTTSDACEASGTCTGVKSPNCCAKSSDCDDGDPCTTNACDVAKGTCTSSAKPKCCTQGACCDLATNAPKSKQTPCDTTSVAVEYQCDGKQVQKREAFQGCNGLTTSSCSTDKANWSWTGWQTVLTCSADQTCKKVGNTPPTCEGGTSTGCKGATDCDDNNPCTKDSCSGGKCSHQAVAGCCTFPSDCDDANACTVDLCESNQCKNQATPCAATADCEVASCDAKTGACKVSVKGGWCKVGDQCAKDGEANPDNSCEACTPGKSQTAWSTTSACGCSSGACCDVGAGQIKGKAAQCDDKVQGSEYRCTKDGKTIEIRQAYRGCTGKSNTCSVSASNYAWTPWSKQKSCGAGTTCEVTSDDKPGVCKPTSTQTCKPGTSCCTGAGAWAKQGTQCGTLKIASEYKCTSTQVGSDVQKRDAFPGCTGQSATCSSATANRAWGAWTKTKDCKTPAKCLVSDKTKPGVCTETTACKPGSTCCTDAGSWAAQKTKCGASAVKKTYSCTSSKPGGSVLVTEWFGGCAGGGATCSYASANLHAAKPTTLKKCSATQTCNVSDPNKPGVCADQVDALCTKADKYESGTSAKNSFDLGTFKDSDSAKILNPKVHFKSESDKDYFTYKLTDSGSSSVAPKLHVEWTAPQAVRVCGYYACDKGTGGKNCVKVACPTGFVSSTSTTVSGTTSNGCCTKTGVATGKLTWEPKLSSSSASLSGRVYFNIRNDSAICQEASVKLEFGAAKKTQCTPGATCCTSQGTFATSKSKCGSSAAKTEYKCSSNNPGGNVLKRQAWRGCTGKSATCSVSSSYYTWTSWSTAKDCKTSETCVVSSTSLPGVCKPLSDPLCSKTDKYESGTYYTSAYNLGDYNDSSPAKVLSPKVHFKNQYDSDYFRYQIADKLNLTDPKVHVEWTGAAEVSVCAYYRCDKGVGGKDCMPVTCPAGSTASTRSSVSNGKPNGCCMTAKVGKLEYKPNAAGTTDESGRVYLRIFNAAPICQEVSAKLVFGSKQDTQCSPNTTCCDGAGSYAKQKSKCGSSALETQYKCSSTAQGAKVQVRKAYAGCTGGSTTCSTAVANRSWGAWATYKQCKSSEVCSVSGVNTAGTCKPAVNPLCSKSDPYDAGTSISKAYNLGTYNDSSSAKVLSPKVLFGSKYDYDYLKYSINDLVNLTDPRVQVEFSGQDKVRVCAYYQCSKGGSGTDCKPVSCPAGTTSSSFFSVSSASPNGCCMEAKSGTLSFKPDAPGTTDETGTVYLRVSNAANVCQEVSAKLVFGSKQDTECNPNTTCCTASGEYASGKSKCGNSALKTEYKCASSSNGGDVLVRKAYAGCTGSSTTCSTASGNWAWTPWAVHKNCSTSQVCSVTDPSVAGVCKTTGSSAPLCGANDKYESGYSTSSAYNVGTFKDSTAALVLDPDVHFKTPYDADYLKYSVEDAFNTNDPTVDVSWTASEPLQVCAWYRCNNGAYGEDCVNVKCPSGTTPSQNTVVSLSAVNGCCASGKTGQIKFKPDAAGTTNETGWAYVRVVNQAKVCQNVNAKLSFGGATKACGDGKCESGESTSCKVDCGACLGKCGKYTPGASCQCDSACVKAGDCCWDNNLYCAQ